MTSVSDTYKPTWLYIKQHTVTGLLYFGKTTRRDVVSYPGSGKYWKSHVRKHGKEFVETLWYCLFVDNTTIMEFSRQFSAQENIGYGDISSWANLIPENGIDGKAAGTKMTEETKSRIGDSNRGKKRSKEFCLRNSESQMGRKQSDESVAKRAKSNTGKKRTDAARNNISNSLMGRTHSTEHRANNAAAKRGKKRGEMSAENKTAISKSMMGKNVGKKRTPEQNAVKSTIMSGIRMFTDGTSRKKFHPGSEPEGWVMIVPVYPKKYK